MTLETIFDIQNIFILKNGVPIYHWTYQDKDNTKVDELNNKDMVLISGFLSAISSFANEIGLGEPKSYVTNNIKFSFLNKNNFLFVVSVDKNIPDEITFEFLNIVSKTFIKLYDVGDIKNFSGINFSDFNDYLFEIIKKFNTREITENEISEEEILQSVNKEMYKKLVPVCYIDVEKAKHLSNSRRELFRLIDGNHSIYNIAEKMNDDPMNIFYMLRPYEKFGYIRINKVSQLELEQENINEIDNIFD